MKTGTLREAANRLSKNYGTMRHYATRYSDDPDNPFPKPLTSNARGRGVSWDIDQIARWWERHDSTKSTGGGHHHKDASARAILGHKFRQIRARNECTAQTCLAPLRTFYGGETIYEVKGEGELDTYHERCWEELCDSTTGGSAEGEESVA